jgi:alpha-tubulin suppressor-like RCC1 family protein
LNATIAYTAGQPTGWLIANLSDSVTQLFGQRVISRQARRATSGGIVTPAVLDMIPNTTNLAAGTYTATVTVSGTNATPGSVNVTYTLAAAMPALSFSPNPVTFKQYAYGSTVAPAQSATVINTGTGTLGQLSESGPVVYVGADTGWLSLSVSGTTITVGPKKDSLALGTDSAKIPFTAVGATNNPQMLTVTTSQFVTYTKVALGAAFGCGLTTASTVYCWGGDGQGELGDGGTDLAVKTPVRANIPYSPTNPVIDIEAGSFHACARLQSGTVYCWGRNDKGQVGVNSTAGVIPTPTVIAGKTYGQITLGALHTCAIESTAPNYVDCWGDNTFGEFGNNQPTTTPQTSPVVTYLMYYSVSAGNAYTCGITQQGVAGNLYCWGDNSAGELGNGYSGSPYSAPQQAQVLTATGAPAVVTSVSTGNGTVCAVDNAGVGYCWGDNTYGEVGNGNTTTPVVTPTIIPGGYSWTSISAGSTSVCGIAATADLCWGYDNYGQLGNGTTANASTPTPTAVIGSGASLFTQFTVGQGSQSSCFITAGVVKCFGLDSNGQLGDGGVVTATSSDTPVPMTAQPAPAGVSPTRVIKRPTVRRQARK